MNNHYCFSPVYRERVWGGRKFASHLGRTDLPAAGRIGESWELVDREDAQSVVSSGSAKGATLRELIESDPEGLMGAGWHARRRFPLLVKWLDCSERLSLQVHPDESAARRDGGEPKTEFWYVAQADAGADVFAGLRPGVDPSGLSKAIFENTLEHEVNRYETHAGDGLYIRAGTLHAIGAGNLILEIQQNSDTTYRVYDWGRPRELHVPQALRCLRTGAGYDDVGVVSSPSGVIANGDYFRITRRMVDAGATMVLDRADPVVFTLLSGIAETDDGEVITAGGTVLVPAGARFLMRGVTECSWLQTDRFAAAVSAAVRTAA